MKTVVICGGTFSVIVLACALGTPAECGLKDSQAMLHVYEVNKRVCDFPEKEDFSTPEAAYAVINRVLASGEQSAWRRISTRRTAKRVPPANAKKKEVEPPVAKMWLNARVLEVRIFKGQHAVILAELKPGKIDKRFVDLEGDRWLNSGQDYTATSLAEARAQTNGKFAYRMDRPIRPRIDDPESYLAPFVHFLKDKAEEPKSFIMEALATHKVVIMGETHHRPRYWAFNASLVTDPDFPKHVGVIYTELPSNDQDLVDQFLAAGRCDTKPVIEMLRDVLWMGWPDQAMLNFFTKVWMVNHTLRPEQRLRIVLTDMQRPWSKIKSRRDWSQYQSTSRDRQMADNITQDLQRHQQDRRNALFITGIGHAGLNLEYFKGAPVMMAGWYLREELGKDKVYAIFPHTSVGTNWGRVDGRLCLGLFDSAFAALGNKPMAFPLDTGPFGKEPFDAFSDRPVMSTYRDGYSAYLYLGPLETEIFSPLIAGFYTDEFVEELERRHRMMFRGGWAEAYRRPKSDAQSFISWMSNSWGKPRRKWRKELLGPMNAWHRGGSDWKKAIQDEKLAYAMEHPEEVVQAARELFEKIRAADYASILGYYSDNKWKEDGWKKFPAHGYYMVSTGWPDWAKWVCTTFTDNPIVSVEVGNVFLGEEVILRRKGWPTVPYRLTLKDGSILEGNLPFEYSFDGGNGHWHGMTGIDWHRQYRSGLPKKQASGSTPPDGGGLR